MEAAWAARGRASVAIPGGETPDPLFEALARTKAGPRWEAVDLFWTDERCVSPSDPRSNYGRAKRLLLERLSPPGPRVHPIQGGADPAVAAQDYDRLLRRIAPDGLDLAILGAGPDGHTAGLFPGDAVIKEKARAAVAVDRPDGLAGVTLTLSFLGRARELWVLSTGARKRSLLERLEADRGDELPVGRLKNATWFLDLEAAGL